LCWCGGTRASAGSNSHCKGNPPQVRVTDPQSFVALSAWAIQWLLWVFLNMGQPCCTVCSIPAYNTLLSTYIWTAHLYIPRSDPASCYCHVHMDADVEAALPAVIGDLRPVAILATADITAPFLVPPAPPTPTPTPPATEPGFMSISDLPGTSDSQSDWMSDHQVLRLLQPLLAPGADLVGGPLRTPDIPTPARIAMESSQEWYRALRPHG
jgi:hypothetical protein